MDFGRRTHTSYGGNCFCVSGNLCRAARSNDVAGRCLGLEADRALEKNAAHRHLGCDGIRDLATDVWPQQHKMAQRGLPDSGGDPPARLAEYGEKFPAMRAQRVESYALLALAAVDTV